MPPEADAVVFPQLLGSVFQHRDLMGQLSLPILILTSEFGTVEMRIGRLWLICGVSWI